MIKVKKGNVHIEGDIAETLTDLTCIIKAIRETDWFEERMLEDVVELSKLSENEVAEKVKDSMIQKLLEVIQDINKEDE